MKFLFDFFPILLFFIAYKLYGIYVATAVAIAASFLQVSLYWLKHRRFEKMHLVTLALIAILGGATLLLQDKAFFMWKPTAVNWAFALGFLLSQIIGDKPLVERMMSHAIEAPRQVWYRLNLSWIGFFILMGFANLYVANFYFQAEAVLFEAAGHVVDLETCQQMYQGQLLELCMHAREVENDWVNFKLFGMLGLTILFVIGQAVYLAKHMKQQPETTAQTEQNNEV